MDSTSPPGVVTNPDWLRRPTGEEVAGYYPVAAMRDGLEGKATIQCVVTRTGMLEHCMIVSETPPGAGFGQAAVAMTSVFRMKPMTVDGEVVEGGTVRLPIRFALPSEPEGGSGTDFGGLALQILLIVGVTAWGASRYLVKPIMAFKTQSPSDVTRIRARLEGIAGDAGPHRKVLEIIHLGGTLPSRYSDSERRYRVTLARPDGSTEQRLVTLPVSFLGEGEMTVSREE
ncbi:MAG: TonB protein [Phenylobacterium sp.]|nr:TonB protein [Phenylobacterium sp.]